MKTLIVLLSALTLSISAFATEKVGASKDSSLQILDLILGSQQTYSQTSGLEAKVIEILAGDGANATRMILVLNTHQVEEQAKIFELDKMMVKVDRITFLAKDVIVINYVQDSFEGEEMTPIQLKKSLKITVKRDAKNQLTDEIITEDISKN